MKYYQLQQKQGLPLKLKIKMSEKRIREWYKHFDGNVYVAFSGGKDSTVLLDVVRSVYPDVPAVYVNTGLEYPEVNEFIKTVDNVTTLRPEMNFKQVLEKYGYPVLSKMVSLSINRYQRTKDPLVKEYRLYGTKGGQYVGKIGVIPPKWHKLAKSEFKISPKCCAVMKKKPMYKYVKETGRQPFIGMLAHESERRKEYYMKFGCNAFEGIKDIQSNPLAFWLDKDIWQYIKEKKIPYCSIYDKGYSRTGCMFCMFGIQLDQTPNRFQLMKKTHPKLWDYCINKLGCGKVLDVIGIEYGEGQTTLEGVL